MMKVIFIIFSFLFLGVLTAQNISAEFYWLGYSIENEKEIGCARNPESIPLLIYVEEKDSLKMNRLSEIAGVKFKRNKYDKNCSNCHEWFTSKKVNKSWDTGKYFTYSKSKFDSTDNMQWYKPKFKSEIILDATKTEKLSYLKGLYLRSGALDSVRIFLTIDESLGKSEATKKLLMNLGFKNVDMKVHYGVPEQGILLDSRAIISFTPTQEFLHQLNVEIDINKNVCQ